MTQEELMGKLAALGDLSNEKRNAVVCALLGHSKIQTHCWGYFSCARCGEQVGDSLAGAYKADKVVVVGHNCKTCRENFAALPWEDILFTPDPFSKNAFVALF